MLLGDAAHTLAFKLWKGLQCETWLHSRKADQLGFKSIALRAVLLTLSLSYTSPLPITAPCRTPPSLQAHGVEFLVVATQLTGVVITGCNLGAQGEHQHTDGSQPHKDTPAGGGGEGGEEMGRGLRAGWLPGTKARKQKTFKPNPQIIREFLFGILRTF